MSAEHSESQVERIHRRFTERSKNWRDLYEAPRYANHLVLSDRKAIAIEFLDSVIRPPASLLDVGCGAGMFSLDAVARGHRVLGLDISEAMIELAQETFENRGTDPTAFDFRVFEIKKDCEIGEEKFDAVVALGFLEYQEDELGTLGVLNRALKQGGMLIVSGPAAMRLSNLCGWIGSPAGLSIHSYSPQKFHKFLSSAGFEVLRIRQHGFADFTFLRRMPWKKSVEFLLHRGFTALAAVSPLDRLGNDIVVLARKIA